MNYFLPYSNKQTIGKVVVQNPCSDEHEQPGEVLVQDLIRAGLPAPRTQSAAPPLPHVDAAILMCVSATHCSLLPTESFCSVFQRDWSLLLLIFFPFPRFRSC